MECIGFETLTVGATAVGFANIPGTRRCGPVTFAGSGNNDLTLVGSSSVITKEYSMVVHIDAGDATSPNTFKVSDDGGSTWKREGVAITGSSQTILVGITGTFGATTGHVTNDTFTFTAYPGNTEIPPMKTVCTLATAQIRSRRDGTNPTATVGKLHEVGDEFTIGAEDSGINDIKASRFIRTGSTSGVLTVEHYR